MKKKGKEKGIPFIECRKGHAEGGSVWGGTRPFGVRKKVDERKALPFLSQEEEVW